jgi:hypothetical protein
MKLSEYKYHKDSRASSDRSFCNTENDYDDSYSDNNVRKSKRNNNKSMFYKSESVDTIVDNSKFFWIMIRCCKPKGKFRGFAENKE